MVALGEKDRQPGGASRLAESDGVSNPRLENPWLAGFRFRQVAVEDVEEEQSGFFKLKMVDVRAMPPSVLELKFAT